MPRTASAGSRHAVRSTSASAATSSSSIARIPTRCALRSAHRCSTRSSSPADRARSRSMIADDVIRVVSGEFGGRRLVVPDGVATRPTTDKVRQAVFNSLDSAGLIDGAVVADLFAGSGALGIEALSRGAASCVFVERDRAALQALRANIAALGLDATHDRRHVRRSRVGAGAARSRPGPDRSSLRVRRVGSAAHVAAGSVRRGRGRPRDRAADRMASA